MPSAQQRSAPLPLPSSTQLEPDAFLKSIEAIPTDSSFLQIKTAFLTIPVENRNPQQMIRVFEILKRESAVILVQNLLPTECPNIASHPEKANTILKQKFTTIQNDVDTFFKLLGNPPPPPTLQNPPPERRLAGVLEWFKRFGS